MSSARNVVIIGGGGAGIALARSLSKVLQPSTHNLILITCRDKFLHYPALIRTLVTDEGHFEDKVLIPYDRLFVKNNGTLIHGEASVITPLPDNDGGSILLLDGRTIEYSYLLLAPGNIWDGPFAFPDNSSDIREHIAQWRKKFKEAKGFCIVGGGSLGIELSGELRDLYPEKDITVVHSQDKLLNDSYPDKFRWRVEERFGARNIKFILGDLVKNVDSKETSRKKIPITADLVIPTWGSRPNTDFVKSLQKYNQSDTPLLTEKGYVLIKPTLQLPSFSNIFACGDILNYPGENKGVVKCAGHAKVVVANLMSLIKGEQPKKEYTGQIDALFMTNGKHGGCGYLAILGWDIIVGDWLVWLLKCRGLFVDMFRGHMGY